MTPDQQRTPADLLVSGSLLLTGNDWAERIPDGAIAVHAGRILAVGPAAELRASHQAAEELDAAGCVLLPGLVNAHTHAGMTLFRGLADDLPLLEWLETHIFPAERRLTGEMVFWGTLLACAELLRAGTTTVGDMYLFSHRAAAAFKQAGLRALVGEGLFDFPSPSYGAAENGLRFTADLWRQWRGDPLIRVGVMPHAAYTCSPELLRRCAGLADELAAPLVMHVAETRGETERLQRAHGCRPMAHLEALGLLGPRFLAVHGVDLDDADIERLARSGAKLAHCPESNLKLAAGIAPVPRLLAAGVAIGLGTDGAASNNNLDLFGEMDCCAKIHKLAAGPTAMPAATVLRLATAGGATALGFGDELGMLAPGRLADFIAVDFRQPHLTPCHDPVSHLVYAARGGDVRHSVIHGRVVMRDRRLTTIDEVEAMARVSEFAAPFRRRPARP
ncbi:MAG: amidohydrolase [Lentisphaeria bacterium]|jgi:5-methylthioadenosine/S-adenosylhomocysteine deaminase